ncbi:MAG: DUF3822 family protein [Paludibacteraceae bacterium]|nr:DUF3822 family protein [Paludibacteraceae bacterium]
MQRKEYSIRNFDAANSYSKILSIRILPDGLCFVVSDPSNNKLLYMTKIIDSTRHGIDIFAEECRANNVLASEYLKTFVIYETSQFTLFPAEMLGEVGEKKIADLNFGSTDAATVLSDTLTSNSISIVYTIPQQHEEIIRRNKPTASIHSQMQPLLFNAMFNSKKCKGAYLHLNIRTSSVDVIYIEGGKLKLANIFSYQTADEFLFFVLGLMDNYHIDQYDVKCVISGEIDEYSSTVQQLAKYIARIEFSATPNGIVEKAAFSSIKNKHQFLTIYQLPICV